ncbi:hypothetical protein CR513_00830, partial [Mucuna pruriens]
MMTELCEQFMIRHHNSTPYHPKMNGAIEVSNKNIKKIVDNLLFAGIWHGSNPSNRSRNTLLKSPGRSRLGRGKMESKLAGPTKPN